MVKSWRALTTCTTLGQSEETLMPLVPEMLNIFIVIFGYDTVIIL